VSHQRLRVVVADQPGAPLNAAITILNNRFEVIGVASNTDAAIEATVSLDADVVVLDRTIADCGGAAATARLAASGSNARVVLISNDVSDESVLAVLDGGASALVAKPRVALDLVTAVSQAHGGGRFIPAARPLPAWRNRRGHAHDLQLYRTDRHLLAGVSAFFATALDGGDSVIAIASRSHLQELDSRLAARGLDPVSLRAAGRYSTLDSSAALAAVCRAGMPDPALWAAALDPIVDRALAASTGATPHVTAFGEIAPMLCARGEFDAMVRLEGIADAYAAVRPISILCGYSTQCLGDGDANALAARICHEHAVVVPADPPFYPTPPL
jgi:CheY-like chemotaxis protein